VKHHVVTEDELRQFEANVQKIKLSRDGVKKHTGRGAGGGGAVTDRRLGTAVKSGTRTSHATNPLMLALTGQLPSGKNQVQLSFKHGKVHKYPNKTFTNWRAKSYLEILEQRPPGPHLVHTKPVSLTVEYWPGDARTRDVSGQLDALFHLLVYAKVLKDDGLVHDVTWRRQVMNRKFPKVLMTVEVL
jgi:Holliday junction resolvase RusA-like endonuclease